jgi:RNA polymerase sigma-70 factor (ECF subfamily)
MTFPTSIWTTLRAIRNEPERVKDRVVRHYRGPVYEFLRRQKLSHEDAEDLTQEVFLRICSDSFLAKVDPQKGKFRSLLLAVSRHVVASFRRRELASMRDRRREVAFDDFEIPSEIEEDPEFDKLWVRNLMAQALEGMKDDPPASALQLQLEGKSYQEIATELSTNETTVTNYIHRAKKRLRLEIERLIEEYNGGRDLKSEIAALVKYL